MTDGDGDEAISGATAPFGYFRLRKTPPYNEEETGAALRRIRALRQQVEELFLYIKHDDVGLAPETVLRLAEA